VTITILNYLHQRGYRNLLAAICRLAYFLKGYGSVKAKYHTAFRAYEFRVRGVSYLSLGPGWAYSLTYLKRALQDTYNFFYLPKPGDCIIDIGAGLGEETAIYALLTGASGRVHALEANPITHAGLTYMCQQNGFTQVTPHHLAIYTTDGEVSIQDDEENYLINTIGAPTEGGITVKAVSLDSLVRENDITCIDFLKVNVEGAEQFLIEGMSQSIHMVQNACISCHDFRHVYHNHGVFYLTEQKVRAFLENNGFEVTQRHTGNRVWDDYLYAKRKQPHVWR